MLTSDEIARLIAAVESRAVPAYLEERCSCSAKFKVPVQAPGLLTVELLKEWREMHHHEFPPEPIDPPTIVDSASSHDRLGDEVDVADRVPAGFAAGRP